MAPSPMASNMQNRMIACTQCGEQLQSAVLLATRVPSGKAASKVATLIPAAMEMMRWLGSMCGFKASRMVSRY